MIINSITWFHHHIYSVYDLRRPPRNNGFHSRRRSKCYTGVHEGWNQLNTKPEVYFITTFSTVTTTFRDPCAAEYCS